MVNKYSKEFVIKVGLACLGKPVLLDGVMVRPYVSGWSNDWFASPWLALQSDPILTDYMCFAKKVSWMSETGEPDL